ncbi:HEAT repeat domain-containing protein [Streptomyces sp. AHU1]|uniref:HEAT repeat domain-containing protein n=1 Tax=Streptomyces sp. AHU1 TaxID=3377215 RepID=UPI0038783174
MDTGAVTPVHLDKVMDGLAMNSALPAPLVRRLFGWRRGMGKVAGRQDLTEDMIAEIIAIDDHWLLHGLALNDRLPDRFRVRLAAHRDKAVRSALVTRAETAPREMLERLVDDPDPRVREHLAQGRHTPPDLRARLAADPDPAIRAALARYWTQAPEAVRRALLTDPEAEVRAAACSTYFAHGPHPKPPPDLLPALLADPVTRAGAVIHAVLDADTLQRLAGDPDGEVRAELARHPGLPPSARDVLAVDPALNVRVKVFARPDTPEHVRAEIHASVHELSRSTADPGPDADDEAVLQWYRNAFARTELRIMRLPWVTADPLPHVDSPYVGFRASAAAAETLPADAVARLLDDEEEIVRLTMAHTAPHLVDPVTAESIERRYRRRDKFTFWWDEKEVLAFSPEALHRFATDPEPRLRSFAPRDPDLPPELAEKLAADPEARVRRAVAPHRNLPLPSLLRLLADSSEHVAEAAGASPFLPVEHMERLLTWAGL